MKRIITIALLVVAVFDSVCQAECVESKKGKKYHKVCKEDGVIESEEIRDEKMHIRREWENEKMTYEAIWDVKKSVGTEKKFLAGKLVESKTCNGRAKECFYHGPQRSFYVNGQLEYEKNYERGILVGVQRAWYENGQLKYEENYKNGKLDGVRRVWHENGRPYEESNYKEDGSVSSRAWDKNGTKRLEYEKKNAQQESISYWDDSGQLSAECNYKCKPGLRGCSRDGINRSWHSNGQLKSEKKYGDDGFEKGWYSNGQVAYEYTFDKEKKIGMRKEWDESGTLRYEDMSYVNEDRRIEKRWYSNGQLGSEKSYKYGKYTRDGVFFRLWRETYDGHYDTYKCEANYRDGKKVGAQRLWENGKLYAEFNYKIKDGKSVLSGEQKWNNCLAVFQSGTLIESNCDIWPDIFRSVAAAKMECDQYNDDAWSGLWPSSIFPSTDVCPRYPKFEFMFSYEDE